MDAPHFSQRELQLLKMLTEGKTNKAIAFETGLTEGTVKEYLSHIFRKAQCSNRAECIAWAKCALFCPKDKPQ